MAVRMVVVGLLISNAYKGKNNEVGGEIAEGMITVGHKSVAVSEVTDGQLQHHQHGVDPEADPSDAADHRHITRRIKRSVHDRKNR